MKILYIDLNCSGNFFESYSCHPKRYGGGGVFARWAKEKLNNDGNIFSIVAPRQCFNDLQEWENKRACIPIDDLSVFNYIKSGHPIDKIFDLNGFDIICTHNILDPINKGKLNIPVVSWSPFGDCKAVHPCYNYSLCYNHTVKIPNYSHQKIKPIIIGKPIPKEFKVCNKENFIFQCTQHCEDFNTIEIAKNCLEFGIKGIFAGPIHDNYPLKDYIDNKITFYLGEIDEETKLSLTSRAQMYTLVLKSNVPFNQSAIEANSLGTPILASDKGWFSTYVQEGVNGYIFNGNNFLENYNKAVNVQQINCYNLAKKYSMEEMIDSYCKSFKEILKEWYE